MVRTGKAVDQQQPAANDSWHRITLYLDPRKNILKTWLNDLPSGDFQILESLFNSGLEEVVLQQSKGTYGYYDDLYISTKAPIVNKAPSKISLSTTDVYENLDAGISLTTLSTTEKTLLIFKRVQERTH